MVPEKNHSTELAALHLTDNITHRMEQGNIPIAIYLDLSKAFDTINHSILLDKLKYYGLQSKALSLLKKYLSDKRQYVEINNSKSNKQTIALGVPQRSILVPLLFFIYINVLPFASKLFKFIDYTDDTTVIANLSDFKTRNKVNNDR